MGGMVWQPGQSGNPRGSKSAGASMVEWRNRMAHWDEARLRAALADKCLPIAKRLAARDLITALREAVDAMGRLDPEPGKIRTRIEERALGKPSQSIDIAGQLSVTRSPDEVRASVIDMLRRLMTQDAGLRLAIMAAMAQSSNTSLLNDSDNGNSDRTIVQSIECNPIAESHRRIESNANGVAPPQAAADRPADPDPRSGSRESAVQGACDLLTTALQSLPKSPGDEPNGKGQ